MFQTDLAERPLVAGPGPLPGSIPSSPHRRIQYRTVTSECPVSSTSLRTEERGFGSPPQFPITRRDLSQVLKTLRTRIPGESTLPEFAVHCLDLGP